MVFLSERSLFVNVFSVIIAVIVGLIIFYKWKFNYWKKRGLPYIKPSFPFGTMENPFFQTMSLGSLLKRNYDEMKALGCKHVGLYQFWSPIYMPIDPEYIKNVLQSDFEHFVDRGLYYNEKDDPLSANVFLVGGNKWKNLRAKLTPTFTSSKMKMIFDTVVQCTRPMMKVMAELTEKNIKIDIKEFSSRFTTDVIGSVAFGVECNSFGSPDPEFVKYLKKVFVRNIITVIRFGILFINHAIGHRLRICMTPQDVKKFFMNVINQSINYRKENGIVRKDMLQLLLDLKRNQNSSCMQANEKYNLTRNDIAAQAYIFYLAGFETSANAMAHCLFEMAKDQNLQERVRKEINDVITEHKGNITYKSLLDMKFLNQVVAEVLRVYPTLAVLTRKCVKDYNVPGTDVVIKKGTNVMIPVLAVHNDPDYYPNPEKFDPGRFSKENTDKNHPYTNLSFGNGRRICIGLRFAMMQIKIALATLIKDYKFTLNDLTELPLVINKYSMSHKQSNTIWLNSESLVI